MGDEEINALTEKIIGCAYTVSNRLGAGFLEKVYENAMVVELDKQGLVIDQQKGVTVFYDGKAVGEYIADLIVQRLVIVELKAVKNIDEVHQAQLMNYLRACKKRAGLILNFGKPKIEIRRILNGYD
jgi:GxxExxY protein